MTGFPHIRGMRLQTCRVLAITALLLAAFLHPVVNQARGKEPKQKQSKLDRVLQKAAASGDPSEQRVIVRARSGRLSDVVNRLERHGDRIRSKHSRLESFTATVHGEDLRALEADSDVQAVSVDAIIRANLVSEEPVEADGPSQNLLRAALGLVDTELDGDKIGIAVIDSGLEKSSDLSGGRADKFFDFTLDGRHGHPYDDYGHGTHVATLIAGKGKDSERDVERITDGKWSRTRIALYEGVAPKADIISLKVLDATGAGYTSSVLSALEFAIENREKLDIDIINLSLGHPIYESPETDPLVRAVEEATRAGIVVVASAGNYGFNQETGLSGYAGITSPGNAPSAITVGALDMHETADRSDDTVASYSSRGPAWYSGLAKPDLVAPGHRLVAVGAHEGALYNRFAERRVWGQHDDKKPRYLRLSGTSMASAVTSGVVALMVQANRETYGTRLTPNTVKAILEYTALPLASEDRLTQGAGGLNGGGAVLLAQAIDPGRPVGGWWLTAPVTPWTPIAGQSFAWSQTVVWGNTVVWGTNALFENQVAWGQTVVWGTTVVWGNTVVWGTTDLVWDDPCIWSSTVVWGTGMLGTTDGNGLSPNTVVWGTLDR